MTGKRNMIVLQDRALRPQRLTSDQVVGKARSVLEESPMFRGRSQWIQIDESDGTLVLEGRLPTYYLKQMLQTVLRDVDGVDEIDNRIAVDWPVDQQALA
jgi:hypothetical protein